MVKNPPASAGDAGDVGSTPGSGRSPRGGNGNLLQRACLENSMDRGDLATVHGLAESDMTCVTEHTRSQASSRKWKWYRFFRCVFLQELSFILAVLLWPSTHKHTCDYILFFL